MKIVGQDGKMGWLQALGRQARAAIAPVVFLALVAYFTWSGTQGDHGSQAFAMRQEQLKMVQAELTRVTTERDLWERRVAGLRTQRLDLDTLDERARAVLNVAEPTDLVVPYGPGKRLY
jgi:cell division protein FtsB